MSDIWNELLARGARAKEVVDSWPAWKQEEAHKALSREFYDPASRWAEEPKGVPPMIEQERIAVLETENSALRQSVEYLTAKHVYWTELLRNEIDQFHSENKRLRYRLKRLWLYDEVRAEIPDWRSLWAGIRVGSELVAPDGEYFVVVAKDGTSWVLQGPHYWLVRTTSELRTQDWHVKGTHD